MILCLLGTVFFWCHSCSAVESREPAPSAGVGEASGPVGDGSLALYLMSADGSGQEKIELDFGSPGPES